MTVEAEMAAAMESTTLAVTGMTCATCARNVERVLSRVSGVMGVVVDFDLGFAIVNGSAAPPKLIAAVEAAGYGASTAERSASTGVSNARQRGCC